MRRVILVALLVGLVGLSSCDTKNIGTTEPARFYVTAALAPVTTMTTGLDATMTATWNSGTAPYTIGINMGGGTTANVPAGTPATSPYTATFTLGGAGTYTYTVTVVDAGALSATATLTYVVAAAGENGAPSVTSTAMDGNQYFVYVSDPDGDTPLTVTVTDVAGLSVDNNTQVADGTGEAVFTWTADNPAVGGEGETTVTVDDGTLTSAPWVETISIPAVK